MGTSFAAVAVTAHSASGGDEREPEAGITPPPGGPGAAGPAGDDHGQSGCGCVRNEGTAAIRLPDDYPSIPHKMRRAKISM
jgi:hypothetical protein